MATARGSDPRAERDGGAAGGSDGHRSGAVHAEDPLRLDSSSSSGASDAPERPIQERGRRVSREISFVDQARMVAGREGRKYYIINYIHDRNNNTIMSLC